MNDPVTLRYFDCRGRAQVLRYLLTEREVEFTDERVPFDDGWRSWGKLKQDPAKSGMFARLPILHWGDNTLAETWVIADFLHQTLDAGSYNDEENKLVRMLQSSILEDVGLVYTVLNLDLAYPGADVREIARRDMTVLSANFKKYQNILTGAKTRFLVSETPTIADYWLYETLTTCEIVFEPLKEQLFENLVHLSHYIRILEERPGIKSANRQRPNYLTARPDYQQRLSDLLSQLQE